MSSNIDTKFILPTKYIGTRNSFWSQYAQLAGKYKPLDLALGFPDYLPPKYITDTLAQVAESENFMVHQYTNGLGHPRLMQVLGKLYSKLIGREISPKTEIVITTGAYDALNYSLLGNVEDGDEVIIIEPYFDPYERLVKFAGGVPRFITLKLKESCERQVPSSADWVLDENELRKLFNSKTKIIILNTPHNPTGKVFSEKELELIGDLCKKWNVLCISDEVYEWFVFKPHKHVRIATLPGMWERTITIGSGGKTFGATGWKLGWAYGPANLIENLQMVIQGYTSPGNTPIQEAAAINFERELFRLDDENSYFNSISIEILEKRDFMVDFLSKIGMEPTVPQGGYFIVADWSPIESRVDLSSEKDEYKDYRFIKWMSKKIGLLGIPLSAFYSYENKSLGQNYVRFCFFKKDETLKKAAKILNQWQNRKK